MRTVTLTARIAADDARYALARIAEFDRYPLLAADVRHIESHVDSSDWEVSFRRGVLRWTEREIVDFGRSRIDFALVSGDFAAFSGHWRVTRGIGGCVVRFTATWDFGIESLAGIMDPIAERVIKRVVCDVLSGLFPATTVLDDAVAVPDLGQAA
ncbi:type II toxin-antitoxin system RatA family toxin [Actinophytocola sediminis]